MSMPKCKRQLEDLLVIARARKHKFTQTINMDCGCRCMLVLVCGVYVCASINVHIDTQDNLEKAKAPTEIQI